MWSEIQSVKWLTYYAAWLCDHEAKRMANVIPLFTSMVKHHVPETAKQIIDEAITVFGGYGYFLEQEVERRYRDNLETADGKFPISNTAWGLGVKYVF